jgi:hypothetical protein
MYCPRCSQQQASDTTQFCSRCGFKLSAVAGLLLTDGVPAKVKAGTAVAPTLFALLLFIIALLLVAASLTYVGPDSGNMRVYTVTIAIITLIFLLLCQPWRLFRKLFSEDAQQAIANQASSPSASVLQAPGKHGARDAALPPAQTLPIAGFSPRRVNTAEMIQPPSITEHTTKLLGDE